MSTITMLMLDEHKHLNQYLKLAKESCGFDRSLCEGLLFDFSEKLRTHLFLEERLIFSFADWKNNDIKKAVTELLSEHARLRELVSGDGFLPDNFEMIEEVERLLMRHESFENSFFYPMLDRELDKEMKTRIVNNIKKLED